MSAIANNNLRTSVLSVGQGDAILIQTPEYKNILIDAGENGQVIEELGKQLSFFDQTIDLFILTHPHLDHFGGLFEILNKYDVKQVMMTGVASENPLYQELINEIKELNIPIIFPLNTKDIQIGTNSYLDILHPNQSFVGQEANNLNNSSIVLRLIEGNNCHILLTGDAEQELEREIILSGQDLNCPILKLGHHGSRTATSDEFLNAIKPETAIISAGLDNKFGHPHQETMDKITNLEVLETMNGTIRFSF
ncbi:MBL fold metallo-hydrolase [Patescibacteria group bacterium]|nr:MBL fold metallo-hydrolase [Patescibacteria group bacterium]